MNVAKIANLKGDRGSSILTSTADSTNASVDVKTLSDVPKIKDLIMFSDGVVAPVTEVTDATATADLTKKVSVKGPAGIELKKYTLEFPAFDVPANGIYNSGATATDAVDINGNHPDASKVVFAMVRTNEHTQGYMFGAVTHPAGTADTNGVYDVNILNQTAEVKSFVAGYVKVDFYTLE